MTFPATFFDGLDIKGRPVDAEIREDGALVLKDGEMSLVAAAGTYSLSTRLAAIPRFAILPEGVLEIPAPDDAESPLAALNPQPGPFDAAEEWLGKRIRVAGAISAVLVALCLVFVFRGLPAMARRVAFAVPAGVEDQIGWASRKALLQYETTAQYGDDLVAANLVRRQLAMLSKEAHTHIATTAVVVNFALPNAFALPGGTVVVTTGLLRLGLSDDEIAAVLAHELGHEELRHGLQFVLRQSSALIVVSMITGDLATLSSFSSSLPILLITRGYSRDFEREADAYAVELLKKVNIDQDALATALAKLQKAAGDKAVSSGYLSTHPGTAARIAAIKATEIPDQPAEYPVLVAKARFLSLSDLPRSVNVFRRAFKARKPDAQDLFDAGVAAAGAGETEEAFTWLEQAIREGLKDSKAKLGTSQLQGLHSDIRWKTLTAEADMYSAVPTSILSRP